MDPLILFLLAGYCVGLLVLSYSVCFTAANGYAKWTFWESLLVILAVIFWPVSFVINQSVRLYRYVNSKN